MNEWTVSEVTHSRTLGYRREGRCVRQSHRLRNEQSAHIHYAENPDFERTVREVDDDLVRAELGAQRARSAREASRRPAELGRVDDLPAVLHDSRDVLVLVRPEPDLDVLRATLRHEPATASLVKGWAEVALYIA